jgi:cob(I)alamin adenosyltransferase
MGIVTTKTGDKGKTYLKDKVVSKGSLTIESIGSIDELIANMILAQSLTQMDRSLFEVPVKKLIEIESYLAGFKDVPDFKDITDQLEMTILSRREQYNGFIYPYDDPKNAQINVLRTVVRRTERTLIRLHEENPLPESLLIFINRLSDYVFVLIG